MAFTREMLWVSQKKLSTPIQIPNGQNRMSKPKWTTDTWENIELSKFKIQILKFKFKSYLNLITWSIW